ncbi:MAG: acylphosphatase [Rhodospirillales bacterium]
MTIDRVAAVAVRVIVEGRVQGVGFRYWTVGRAARLGLRGWVRNLRDGSVEALFAGDPAAVEEMIGACRQGPGTARVDAVKRFTAEVPPEPGFHDLPTA